MEFLQVIAGLIFGYLAYGFMFDWEKKDIKLISEKDRKIALNALHVGFLTGYKSSLRNDIVIPQYVEKLTKAYENGQTIDRDLIRDISDEIHTKKPKLKVVGSPAVESNEITY